MTLQNLHGLKPNEFFENVFDTVREPLLVLDSDLRVLKASRSFYRSFQVSPSETEGFSLFELGNGQWDIPALTDLMERITTSNATIEAFEVTHEFQSLGRRTFLLNARKVLASTKQRGIVLLALEDITERKIAEEKLLRLALTDPLTGLANRNRFVDALDKAIKMGRRFGLGMALLLMDLDKFKPINDTHGHPVGDALLQAVAAVLAKGLREVDTVARLGGDEFAVVLEGVTNKKDAEQLAERYVDALAHPFEIGGKTLMIGASVGISYYPSDADNAADMFRRADLALYKAKHAGGSTYSAFLPEMED